MMLARSMQAISWSPFTEVGPNLLATDFSPYPLGDAPDWEVQGQNVGSGNTFDQYSDLYTQETSKTIITGGDVSDRKLRLSARFTDTPTGVDMGHFSWLFVWNSSPAVTPDGGQAEITMLSEDVNDDKWYSRGYACLGARIDYVIDSPRLTMHGAGWSKGRDTARPSHRMNLDQMSEISANLTGTGSGGTVPAGPLRHKYRFRNWPQTGFTNSRKCWYADYETEPAEFITISSTEESYSTSAGHAGFLIHRMQTAFFDPPGNLRVPTIVDISYIAIAYNNNTAPLP